jgi:glycosyltransferase involved in cell wall biosynthesis
VAICICTRSRPESLAATLESIAQSTRRVELVVVSDDGHDEATASVCVRAAHPVRYVLGPRLGLGPNRNHALRQTRQDLLLFLDDDCLLGRDFLATALGCLATAEATHGAGRVIVSGAEKTPRQDRKLPAAQTFLGFQARPYAGGDRLTSININCTLFPRSVFDRYTFDPLIRYGYDEVDLASRAAREYTISVCPDAVNDHRPSPAGRGDYEAFKTASRFYVTFKRYALTEKRYALALAYVVLAPVHAVLTGGRRRGVSGVRDALSAAWLAAGYVRLHLAGGRGAQRV